MANHKSSIKRARQTVKKNTANTLMTSTTRTMVKNVRLAIENKDKAKAQELMSQAQSLLSTLAKKGVIKRNTAARKISRLAAQAAKI